MESKQDSGWLQGTRRHTRSASNQEKEAKVFSLLCITISHGFQNFKIFTESN